MVAALRSAESFCVVWLEKFLHLAIHCLAFASMSVGMETHEQPVTVLETDFEAGSLLGGQQMKSQIKNSNQLGVNRSSMDEGFSITFRLYSHINGNLSEIPQ